LGVWIFESKAVWEYLRMARKEESDFFYLLIPKIFSIHPRDAKKMTIIIGKGVKCKGRI
jgi:hypothetical protein